MDSGGIIAATNTLGVRLNIPDVQYIFHLGIPHKLQDFTQESGQARRDRLESQSVIVASRPAESKRQGQQRGLVPVQEQERLKEAGVTEYIQGEAGYQRIYLDSVIDDHQTDLGAKKRRPSAISASRGTGVITSIPNSNSNSILTSMKMRAVHRTRRRSNA